MVMGAGWRRIGVRGSLCVRRGQPRKGMSLGACACQCKEGSHASGVKCHARGKWRRSVCQGEGVRHRVRQQKVSGCLMPGIVLVSKPFLRLGEASRVVEGPVSPSGRIGVHATGYRFPHWVITRCVHTYFLPPTPVGVARREYVVQFGACLLRGVWHGGWC